MAQAFNHAVRFGRARAEITAVEISQRYKLRQGIADNDATNVRQLEHRPIIASIACYH